jgi:hypothetical protein
VALGGSPVPPILHTVSKRRAPPRMSAGSA